MPCPPSIPVEIVPHSSNMIFDPVPCHVKVIFAGTVDRIDGQLGIPRGKSDRSRTPARRIASREPLL